MLLFPRPDFFTWLAGAQYAPLLQEIGEIVEDGCKVLAEALFLSGFASALMDARSMALAPAAEPAGQEGGQAV